jgi:hypothetical protein
MTIYEIFEERVRSLREVCDLGDVDDKIPLSELRQSFIAMVEGEN